MPRLTTPYSNGVPVLVLNIVASGPAILLAGIVDSGADRTLLPKAVAPAIGIPETSLIPTPQGSGGAGGTSFPTWDLPPGISIAGHVMAFTPHPQPWGPAIPLAPQFAENATPLFGRADFFQAFVITFARDANLGELFHLDH